MIEKLVSLHGALPSLSANTPLQPRKEMIEKLASLYGARFWKGICSSTCSLD
jgi:hypothetical protein